MAGFAERIDEFEESRVQVIALSADDEEGARKMKERVEPGFPILYGLDVHEVQEKIGCYATFDQDPPFIHASGVILDPEGCVRVAVYSSGAIGRLQPESTLKTVRGMMDSAGDGDAEEESNGDGD